MRSGKNRRQLAPVYFDFSSDFLYFPFVQEPTESAHHVRSIPHPDDIYFEDRHKIKKVIHEMTQSTDEFFHLALHYGSTTEVILVDEKEGMIQGVAELSDFQIVTDTFLWQQSQTLYQVYHDVSHGIDEGIGINFSRWPRSKELGLKVLRKINETFLWHWKLCQVLGHLRGTGTLTRY
jgi:hypothetical protein